MLPLLHTTISRIGLSHAARTIGLNNRQTITSWLRLGLPWPTMERHAMALASLCEADSGRCFRLTQDLVEESKKWKLRDKT